MYMQRAVISIIVAGSHHKSMLCNDQIKIELDFVFTLHKMYKCLKPSDYSLVCMGL